MRAWTLLAVFFAATALADEPPVSKEDVTVMVNALADCGGLYEAMSEFEKSLGHTNSSQNFHETSNGSVMAAAYLLLLEYESVEGRPPKKLSDFTPYPQGRADASKTSVLASLERQDAKSVEDQAKKCGNLMPVQVDIIQMIRDRMVGR